MPKESIYPVEQLNKLEKNKNNSYEKKYIAVDFEKEIGNPSSVKDKRKIVCIERNKENELAVKNYDNGALEQAFQKVKTEGREIYLVLYVKASEQQKCTQECKKILRLAFDLDCDTARINKLRKQFKDNWKNFREFNDYAEMKCSYDEKTGEHIINVLADLTAIKGTIRKRYKAIEGEFEGRTSTLESILQEMDKKYKEATENHQHLEVGTYSPLATALDSCVSKFDAELKQLRKEDSDALQKGKCIILKNEIEVLQRECRGAIPSDTLCTEELVNKKNKINTEINLFYQWVEKLVDSIPTDTEIDGLRKKFDNFQAGFDFLKAEIESLPKIQEKNIQSVQNMPAETNSLFNEVKALLSEIKKHQTDEAKTEVKEKLINKIEDILSQQHETSSAGLNKAVEEAKNFIDANVKATNYTGWKFFGGHSVLGKLMDRLKILLDEFLNVLSKIHPNNEKHGNAYSVSPK